MQHPVPDRIKPAICNFCHPGTLALRADTGYSISCTHMATVGVEGLMLQRLQGLLA